MSAVAFSFSEKQRALVFHFHKLQWYLTTVDRPRRTFGTKQHNFDGEMEKMDAKNYKWTDKKKARPCYHVRGRYPALSHKSGLCGTSFPVLFRAANCNLSCGLLELCQDKSAIRNAVSPSWGRRCTSQCRCGSHCLGWFWNGLTHRVAQGLPVVCTKIGSSSLYPVGPEEKTNDSRRQVVKCTLAKQHGLWRLQMCKLTVNSLSTTAIIRARHSCAAWRVK